MVRKRDGWVLFFHLGLGRLVSAADQFYSSGLWQILLSQVGFAHWITFSPAIHNQLSLSQWRCNPFDAS